jgi:LacI family transcriptional regulator
MPVKRITLDDIARVAGVSKATVSAVLNHKGSVQAATRDRVLAASEQLNYRPGANGRGAGEKRSRCLGLLIREMDNPFYADVAAGVRAVAGKQGYTVLVASSEGDPESERQTIELLQDKEVDGLILFPVLDEQTDLSALFELKRRNFPFVLLEEIWGVKASLVGVDNTAASRKAVEYLISLGHTRIVHFAGPPYSMHSRERIDGMFRAFSGLRIALAEEAIVSAGAHLEDGYHAGLRFFRGLSAQERPTAATCFNDMVALGLCRALAELGLKVPDDVSIIGYDNLGILEHLPLPLTSVHVPKREMGEEAARLLIRQIEGDETIEPERLVHEARLVVRSSTRTYSETGRDLRINELPVVAASAPRSQRVRASSL